MWNRSFLYVLFFFILLACKEDPSPGDLSLVNAYVGTQQLNLTGANLDLPVDRSISILFSTSVDPSSAQNAIAIFKGSNPINSNFKFSSEDKNVLLSPLNILENGTEYTLVVSSALKGSDGQSFNEIRVDFATVATDLELLFVEVDGQLVDGKSRVLNVSNQPDFVFAFSEPISSDQFKEVFNLTGPSVSGLDFSSSSDGKTQYVSTTSSLAFLRQYDLKVSDELSGATGEPFDGFELQFFTQVDSTYKFPEISDDELLTTIQSQTFKYFWDFAHPVSGMARERNTSGNTVTVGGSGFGVMGILTAISRGFITRQEGIDRLETIIDFLKTADRFHGVWPHWLNGNTGKTIPFSSDDDGADLVETAFMIQGLLTVREFLNSDAQEQALKNDITQLWEEVEWDWFTQGGQDVLYWHWSPNFGWVKNHKIQGWNEALIVYVLAAASPTHTISADVYNKGWARSGAMENGNSYYGTTLPLGPNLGGPLFFSHYSFLGLDPRNLVDQYADYWEQNTNQSLINQAYCQADPLVYAGYGEAGWGLTASDSNGGYSAHSPTNDKGVLTPTAAISSIAYTPEKSMQAIHNFYYLMGDKLWGSYGFYDAYNVTANWYASSFLAIDQGPIVVMIENYRTALLWDLFMQNSEVANGLDKLGFESY